VWLGERTAPNGRVVALARDLSLADARATNVECRVSIAEPPEMRAFWAAWLW
jgi:hypothetical protein